MNDRDLVYRALGRSDIDALFALHCAVLQSLENPGFLYPRPRHFFERVIAGDGLLYGGLTSEGRLVAYATLIKPGTPDFPDIDVQHLGLAPGEVGHGGGIAVHPDFRDGRIMPELIRRRAPIAGRLGFGIASALVAVENAAGLRTVHEMGYVAAGSHGDADGDNFVLVRALAGSLAVTGPGLFEIGLDEPRRNLAQLAGGELIGVPVRSGGARVLRYFPASTFRSAFVVPDKAIIA